MSHDNYMGKYALITGEIIYIDRVMINHRRHGDNTTGAYSMKLSPLRVLKRAIIQFNDLAKTHARVYNQTLVMISLLEMVGLSNNEVKDIRSAIRKGGVKGIAALIKFHVKRKQPQRTIGIYMIMGIGAYKKYIEV